MLKNFVFHNLVYNTFPIVVHFPGIKPRNSPLWSSLLDFKRSLRNSVIEEATIITWNNQIKKGSLENSLDYMGVNYNVLGKNVDKWNNIFKIDLTVEALKTINSEYTIGLDSCDVVVLDDPNKIVERFKTMECKLLFNSQSYCYPRHNNKGELYNFVKIEDKISGGVYKNCYLNAGVWIGETEFCRKFFDKCKEVSLSGKNLSEIYWKISEQVSIRSVFPIFSDCIKLDYESKIFQVLEDDQSKLRFIS